MKVEKRLELRLGLHLYNRPIAQETPLNGVGYLCNNINCDLTNLHILLLFLPRCSVTHQYNASNDNLLGWAFKL